MFFGGLQHMDIPVLADQQKTYIHQLCADKGCRVVDLLGAMVDSDGEEKRVKRFHAINMTW